MNVRSLGQDEPAKLISRSKRSLSTSSNNNSLHLIGRPLCPDALSDERQRRILESKRRASRKKNQKRREAAKKKAKLLNGQITTTSTTMTNSSDVPEQPAAAVDQGVSPDSFPVSDSHKTTKLEGSNKNNNNNTSSNNGQQDDQNDSSPSCSESSSPSLVSESTFSTTTSVEVSTPAALSSSGPDYDHRLSEPAPSIATAAPEEDIEAEETPEEAPEEQVSTPLESVVNDAAECDQDEIKQDTVSSIKEYEESSLPCSPQSSTDTAQEDAKQVIASPKLSQEDVTESKYTANPSITAIPAEPSATLSSWDMASETVANVALQCLSKDKDMELSYVALLSALTVLQTEQDQSTTIIEQESASKEIVEAKKRVAGVYSRILSLMCVPSTVDGLAKEIQQQGVMAPESLYSQFYGSIQQAGYDLQDEAYLAMAQYWMNRGNFEDAQECLHRIDTASWSGPAYRTSIRCLLMSKPRQLRDAESTLHHWITLQPDQENKSRAWFQLQLEASRWEDAKTLYERKRSRLLDAPTNLDRVNAEAETRLTPQALHDHQLHEQQSMSPPRQTHQRSVSITSSTTTSSLRHSPTQKVISVSGHQRSPSGQQRTPATATAWPSGAAANATATAAPTAVAKGTFSFLSSFKFGAKSSEGSTATTTAGSTVHTALPSRLNVSRHLTVLDNIMLEDCIAHKQFEYGWRNIYERMGPSLEDGDTSRIAMRLCRRAFLGHGGLSLDQPGSPNTVAKDTYFDAIDLDVLKDDSLPKPSDRDPALWEARAWVIYNKAMLNPHALHSKTTGATTPLLLPGDLAGTGSSPMAMFWHDILTISIHSPEVSSRYLKCFKVYVSIRSDPLHHQQLRDPFVMSCMLKGVYDAALAIVHNADQPPSPLPADQSLEALKRHRRTSSLSLNRKQPITLGPIIDLAFEIYADMRQVGPIRHLPSLLTLAPSSPSKGSQKGSETPPRVSLAESRRSDVLDNKVPSTEISRKSSVSVSSRSSIGDLSMPVFQDLNPTLKPNPQAKSLPVQLYLGWLHLCIQVPVFRLSSMVVKTIVADLHQSEAGAKAIRQDNHLAVALQSYHDTWMCSQVSLTAEEESSTTSCVFFESMYKPLDPNESQSEEPLLKENEIEVAVDGEAGSAVSSSCNENLHWDLWSDSDPALKDVQFTPQRATKLWDHVAQALL
ncbi:hypothetical protein BGZ83_007886 [Gryganskiella cystojenkinii]|nr:hypothetical protein BGZ83_007886 [Gryganskiella cystojenkinii]